MAGALVDDNPVLKVSCNESFTHGLLHAMWGMKDRAEMTDFTIKLDNLTIPCHSVVLAAVSDYFHTLLLQTEMCEAKERCVELQEMDEECLQCVVEYCYTGNINVQLSDAHACLNIAHYLRITPLVHQLEAFVNKHLRPDNVIGWYMRADKLQLQELLAASKPLMLVSFTDVVKHREFHQLTVTELQDYITQKTNDADAVLDACVSWAQYNVEARCDNFMELLQYIQLDNCSKVALQAVLHALKPSWPNYRDVQKELAWRIVLENTADTSVTSSTPPSDTDKSGCACATNTSHTMEATSHKHYKGTRTKVPAISPTGPSGTTYSTHGRLPNARSRVAPANLKTLILGGFTDTNNLNNKIWKMDVLKGTCEEVGKMAQYAVKYDAVYCSSKKGVLVVGGSKALNDDRYEPTGECSMLSVPGFTWDTATSLRQDIGQATAVCVSHHVYTFGNGGDRKGNAVYCFNMNAMKWSRCRDMPFKNSYPIVDAVGDKVYTVFNTTGYNEKHRKAQYIPVHCFNTKKRSWSSRKSLPASVCNDTCSARMVNIKDELFMVGGENRVCLKYLQRNDKWTRLKRPAKIQRHFSVAHVDGKIVTIGGYGEDADDEYICRGTIQVYDIAADTWRILWMRTPVPLKSHNVLCTMKRLT